MKCLVCRKPVPSQGETLPELIHVGCMGTLYDDIVRAERQMFSASIPRGGKTVQFRRFANLTLASNEIDA